MDTTATPIMVGDYVVPDDEYAKVWTPCKVLNLYKNGNLRARSDDLRVSWHGPADGFILSTPKETS